MASDRSRRDGPTFDHRESSPAHSGAPPRGQGRRAAGLAVVAGQEFRGIARSGAFLITTLAGLVVIALLTFLPSIIDFFVRLGVKDLAVFDPEGPTYEVLAAAVEQAGAEHVGFRVHREEGPASEDRIRALLSDGQVDAVLEVRPGEGLAGEPAFILTTRTATENLPLAAGLADALQPLVWRERSARLGIPSDQWMPLTAEPVVRVEALEEDATAAANPVAQFFLTYGMLFLLYLPVIGYGATLMNGIVMEKANRVVEVLLAAVSPAALVFGKLAGVGLAGLLQMVLWALAGTLLAAWSGAGEGAGVLPVSPAAWAGLGVAFVLAFLTYGALYAVVGAMSGRAEDASQLQMPVTLLLMGAFFAGLSGLNNPDGVVVRTAVWIPPATPMALLVRLIQGRPVWWELAGATGLTVLAAWILLMVAGRVYARAALRTQRVGWVELLRTARSR